MIKRQRWRLRIALFLSLLVVFYWMNPFSPRPAAGTTATGLLGELTEEELAEGRYFRVVDESGNTVVVTGRRLRAGDQYLDSHNRLYEIDEIDGYLARARFREQVQIELPPETPALPSAALPAQGEPSRTIAIYHSHNAESYVPSDGTDSIYGRGGIHDVGAAFRRSLEQKGINVIHSEQLHLPHDRGAYRRSRVTASGLLRQGPDAIYDVHRDAAPWDAYALELDGEWVTQIQFVVGLSNPGTNTNRQYAFDLKGYADRLHPGLVKGVFLVWGGYNQDLSPLSLLLEVGAHTNSKEAAMRGIERFADVVAFYFYGGTASEPDKEELPPAPNRDAWGIVRAVSGTVLGLLLTSLGAALGFYFLNNPGALGKLFDWWESLPARAAAWMRRFVRYLKNLPALLRRLWRRWPQNLRRAWRQLRRESGELPSLFNALAAESRVLLRRLAEIIDTAWREAPDNLRRAWAGLGRDRKALTLMLRRLPVYLARTAARLEEGLAGGRDRARANFAAAWTRAGEEGAFLRERLRVSLLILRRRLRP